MFARVLIKTDEAAAWRIILLRELEAHRGAKLELLAGFRHVERVVDLVVCERAEQVETDKAEVPRQRRRRRILTAQRAIRGVVNQRESSQGQLSSAQPKPSQQGQRNRTSYNLQAPLEGTGPKLFVYSLVQFLYLFTKCFSAKVVIFTWICTFMRHFFACQGQKWPFSCYYALLCDIFLITWTSAKKEEAALLRELLLYSVIF